MPNGETPKTPEELKEMGIEPEEMEVKKGEKEELTETKRKELGEELKKLRQDPNVREYEAITFRAIDEDDQEKAQEIAKERERLEEEKIGLKEKLNRIKELVNKLGL